jgi:hypothetical protein
MQSALEALYKSRDKIIVGWNPEPGVQVTTYNIYVGLAPVLSSLTRFITGVPPYRSDNPQTLKKVTWEVTLSSVQTALGITTDFTNTLLYFSLTYSVGATESLVANSTLVEVSPVGFGPLTRNSDNMAYESFNFGFSSDIQRWVKMASTATGAVIFTPSDFDKPNITTLYTYDTTNLKTTLSYPSDQTVAGSLAKLTTYTYVGSQLTKVVVTDSTV